MGCQRFASLKAGIETYAKSLPRTLGSEQLSRHIFLELDYRGTQLEKYGEQYTLFFEVLVWNTGYLSQYLEDGYSASILTNECNQADVSDDCFESGGSFYFLIAAQAGTELISRNCMIFFFPQKELPVLDGYAPWVPDSLSRELRTCITVRMASQKQKLNLSAAAECVRYRFKDYWATKGFPDKVLRGVAIAPDRALPSSTADPKVKPNYVIGKARRHGGVFSGSEVPKILSVPPFHILPDGAELLFTILPPRPWSASPADAL